MAGSAMQTDTALIDDVADWLMSRALEDSSVEAILQGCCTRLVAADIPVSRVALTYRTLHPLFRAIGLRWRRGGAVETDELLHGTDTSVAFLRSPFHHLLNSGLGFLRRRLEGDRPTLDFPLLAELRDQERVTDYVAWAVPFGPPQATPDARSADGLLGSWSTDQPGGFTDAHLIALKRVQRRLAVACKVTIKNQITHNVLAAYLGPDAAERVYSGSISRGSGENIHAVIWFADLRDSTRLSTEMPVEAFLGLLNEFFECIAEPVLEKGGEVLRFIGDAVLAIFPMRGAHSGKAANCPIHRAACETALAAALEAIRRAETLNARRAAQGKSALRFGIGLHVGDVMYGNIGVPSRVEFSVVGAAANHAAKIELLCKLLDVPLVVSQEFSRIAPGPWQSMGRHRLPGIDKPQRVSTLAALLPTQA